MALDDCVACAELVVWRAGRWRHAQPDGDAFCGVPRNEKPRVACERCGRVALAGSSACWRCGAERAREAEMSNVEIHGMPWKAEFGLTVPPQRQT